MSKKKRNSAPPKKPTAAGIQTILGYILSESSIEGLSKDQKLAATITPPVNPSIPSHAEIVKVCNDLANQGMRVIVAGLDMDFKGNPFGPMPALMATAEYVTKVHAVCTRTGNLAHFSYRKAQSDDLVLLGETEEYEPLSRAAYYKAMLRERVKKIDVKDPEQVSSKKQA